VTTGENRERIEEAREPTEEELRAAYEAQVKRLRVEHVVLETVVTLANLGMRRTGLAPGTEDERDPEQVRLSIESIRALMPLVEQAAPEQANAIRDALSQLQLAFVRIGGEAAAEPSAAPPQPDAPQRSEASQQSETPQQPGTPQQPDTPPQPGTGQQRDEPGPAQRSGRLWVPRQ
jgi:hypothetical protein